MYPSRIHSIQSIVVVVVWPTDNLCKTITVNITTIPLSADITHDTLIQWYTQHKMQDWRVFDSVGMQSCKITLISTFAIFLATGWKKSKYLLCLSDNTCDKMTKIPPAKIGLNYWLMQQKVKIRKYLWHM